MNRFVLAAVAPMLLFSPLLNSLARADLTGEVNAILREKSLAKVQVGIDVVRLGTSIGNSQTVYHRNNELAMTPASNLKVITTSAALDRLGPDFKFRTQLVLHDGNLILIGDGDPSFGDAELLTRFGWDVTTVFSHWADQIKQLKLDNLKGVIVDDSIFDQDFFHANWPVDQRLKSYEAEVSGMNLNVNCIDLFVKPTHPGQPLIVLTNPPSRFVTIINQSLTGQGQVWASRAEGTNDLVLHGKESIANQVPDSVTIHDGPMYAATVFNQTLATAGVTLPQAPKRDRTIADTMRKAIAGGDKSWQVLAVHETPLLQVINRANKDSMNLYGECLCKRVGAQATGEPGSWKNGTQAVGSFLEKIGVPANQFHLDDGCGLSKENLITPSAMVSVLLHNYFSPNAKAFLDSLSVAGSDGTLADRFTNSTLRGRVFGKTGTVNGVSCLSGYLNARDGSWYAFSIMLNKTVPGLGKPFQEKVVAAVDGMY